MMQSIILIIIFSILAYIIFIKPDILIAMFYKKRYTLENRK